MNQCLRIAFVTGHYKPLVGGIESHVEQIARRLVILGHHVELFTQADDSAWPKTEILDGVLVHRSPVPIPSPHLPVSPVLWRTLRRRRTDFDVFHVHGYHSIVPLITVLSRCQPIVFTPHYHGTGHSPLRKMLHKPYRLAGTLIAKNSGQIICVSRAEAELFEAHFPFTTPRVRVIPNGVDLTALQAAPPKQISGTLVVSAGRLESYKQVDKTVSAMSRLSSDYTLIITGDGPERTRLTQLALDLGLQDRIQFLGRIDVKELYEWYQRADVYVSMSSNEAMPVTIVELLATGARVVASNIPAHRDIQNVTGGSITRVSLDASPDIVAQAIRAAAASSAASDQRIPTWDEITERTLAVYRQAVTGV